MLPADNCAAAALRCEVREMGFWTGLESSLEKYIEGFFRQRFRGRVQPMEIARCLTREMRNNKRISVSSVYAPNLYKVYLPAEDWQAISGIAFALEKELAAYLEEKAGEKGFAMVAPVKVVLAQEDLPAGQVRVETAFSQEESVPQAAGEPDWDDTKDYRFTDTAPLATVQRPEFLLAVISGDAAGETLPLYPPRVVLGRRAGCDIVLKDPGVSRRHAVLEWRGDRWVLLDAGSTNGTLVNGKPAVEVALRPGDIINVGHTALELRRSEDRGR